MSEHFSDVTGSVGPTVEDVKGFANDHDASHRDGYNSLDQFADIVTRQS